MEKSGRNFRKFFLTLALSLTLGLGLTIYLMQNDPWVTNHIAETYKAAWQEYFNCDISCDIASVNLFIPRLRFNHISMSAKDNSWSWKCEPFEISCSWLDLFFYGTVATNLHLGTLIVHSQFDTKSVAFWPHFLSLFSGPSWIVPVFLKALTVDNATFYLNHGPYDTNIEASFSADAKTIGGIFKSSVHLLNGNCTMNHTPIIEYASAPIRLDIQEKGGNIHLIIESNGVFESPLLKNYKTCFFSGTWNYEHGLFYIKNQDSSFVISPIKLYYLGSTLFLETGIKGQLQDVAHLAFESSTNIVGDYILTLQSSFGPIFTTAQADLLIKNFQIGGIDCFSLAKLSFTQNKKNELRGHVAISRNKKLFAMGNVNVKKEEGKIICDITNKQKISIPGTQFWEIIPEDMHLYMTYNPSEDLSGVYSCFCTNKKFHEKIKSSGSFKLNNHTCTISGDIKDQSYQCSLYLHPNIRMKQVWYKDKQGEPLFHVAALEKDHNKIVGTISFPLLQKTVETLLDYQISGEGDIQLYGMHQDGKFLCHSRLKNGSIGLPTLYNFVKEFSISSIFSPKENHITIQKAAVTLHRGTIICKKGIIYLDNNSYRPIFIYAPTIFHNCLINYEKDFFALLSGRLLFYQQKNIPPLIKGIIMIDQAQMKKNIFSQEFQKSFFNTKELLSENQSKQITTDISIITKDHIGINTPFLETQLSVDVSIKEQLFNPHFSGKIDLASGKICFPYKPLHITKGSIYFLPDQMYDPLIELVARNRIKKYDISLYVTGSLQNQHISLQSSPALSEEQIVALLLAGSPEASLKTVMPSLIMQNIKHLIFDTRKSCVDEKKSLSRLLRPFKNFNIVPSFTDQSGRGGLRGAIEVDIGERWRTFIQKNFSLSEDTKFELEYLLSDDITIRGIRNERGDIGGEVEMRWQF